MQQLQFNIDAAMSHPPKPPRPESKPYQPNTACRRDYYISQGAYLDWTRTFGRFSDFLSQPTKDPKLQKAREFKWEGTIIKVPAYHWREYEEGVYHLWLPLYRKHLLGLTTNHFEAHKWDRDWITERIEDGMTASGNFTTAFFDTLRHFDFTGHELDKAWGTVEKMEKLKKL